MNQHNLIIQEWAILKHCTDLGCLSRLILKDIEEYSPILRQEMNYRFNSQESPRVEKLVEDAMLSSQTVEMTNGVAVDNTSPTHPDTYTQFHPFVEYSRGTR